MTIEIKIKPRFGAEKSSKSKTVLRHFHARLLSAFLYAFVSPFFILRFSLSLFLLPPMLCFFIILQHWMNISRFSINYLSTLLSQAKCTRCGVIEPSWGWFFCVLLVFFIKCQNLFDVSRSKEFFSLTLCCGLLNCCSAQSKLWACSCRISRQFSILIGFFPSPETHLWEILFSLWIASVSFYQTLLLVVVWTKCRSMLEKYYRSVLVLCMKSKNILIYF